MNHGTAMVNENSGIKAKYDGRNMDSELQEGPLKELVGIGMGLQSQVNQQTAMLERLSGMVDKIMPRKRQDPGKLSRDGSSDNFVSHVRGVQDQLNENNSLLADIINHLETLV